MFQTRISVFVIFFNFFASTLFAGTYYVANNGSAAWADCEHNGGTPGAKSGTSACSLKTANSNVSTGDIIYLREGTYHPTGRTDNIHPGVSGTSGNRITYENYNDESVIIDGTRSHPAYEAILFSPGWDTGDPDDGRSYITVRGITFQNWNKLADFYYASYNEIDSCIFTGHIGDGLDAAYMGCEISHESTHNYIHDNTWHNFGHFVGSDQGTILNIGFDIGGDAEDSGNNYNTVENNHFYASGHHILGVNNGKFNVIRNNYMHNEGWSTAGGCSDWDSGTCGYRVVSMTDNSGLNVAGSNLLENNNIAYGAQYGGPHLVQGASGSGFSLSTKENIVRYNKLFGHVEMGIRIGSSIANSPELDNRIYNNTIYYSGYNLDSWGVTNEDDASILDIYRTAFMIYSATSVGNVIKNNLAHDTFSETNKLSDSLYYPAFYSNRKGSGNTMTNNWGHEGDEGQYTPYTPYPDPKFVDPDIDTPMDLTFSNGEWTGKPDLSLQSSSPCIDKGTHLTQANGSGSSSPYLIVDDARYFQDGKWGSSLANLRADWIAIGTVSNTVRISSINYSTNRITLASPMTWDDNANVWLYKISDGTTVLFGAAPDLGAHENSNPPAALNSPDDPNNPAAPTELKATGN